MEEGLSAMALSLCWVIETLARSGQIGSAILYELLLKAPPLSGKSGRKVREAVAFRCLEELAGPSSDHPTPNQSKHVFDASDNCEDVLQLVLRENPGIDLRKDASDELKWNIRSFIELKKARLPKCSLDLLQNLIVEGTHPIIESLKEIKEIELPSQRVVTIASSSVDPTSPSSTVHENGRNSQATLVEENKDSSKDRIIYQQSLLPTGNSPYSIRGTTTSSDRVQGADDITHGLDDHDPLVKKRKLDKQDDLQSHKQPSVACDGNGMSSATDGQNHESPKARQERNGNSNNENLGDRMKVYSHFDTQPQTSHDIDGHLSVGSEDFAKKILAFFRSGSFVPDDSLVMNETELNLCMKCNNNGGDMLICGSTSCLLAFHESCLGYSASFDDQGKFNCPFCAYSRAISECVKAKEKVSLTKRELSLFMGRRTSHEPQPDSARALGDDDDNGQRRKEDISKKVEQKISVNNVVTKVASHYQLRGCKSKQKEVSSSTANKAENHSLLTASLLSEINVQLPCDTTGTQNQEQGNHKTDGGNQSNQNENMMDTRQNSSDLERKKDTAKHQATEHHEDVNSETISDSDELSEDGKIKTTTSTLSPTPIRQFRPNSQSKRKKVQWTAEEEAMLKEGVQTYGQGGNRVIPWKSILKLGGSVFHEGRTAIDLKDKWRNMHRSLKVK